MSFRYSANRGRHRSAGPAPECRAPRHRLRPLRVLLLAGVMSLSSGCAFLPMFENFPILGSVERFFAHPRAAAPEQIEPAPPARPETIPEPGSLVSIYKEYGGNRMFVTFGGSYVAASGRYCAHIYEPGRDVTSRSSPDGVACWVGNPGWVRLPDRIPVSPGP
jgi:hypothetical protein